MGLFGDVFDLIAGRNNKAVQGYNPSQRYRDYQKAGESYSVEADISVKLASLAMMLSTMPVSGDSDRAKWLDGVADKFYQTKAVKMLTAAFISGDCLVVPSWTGRTVQNILIPSDEFAVMETIGDEITSCAYVIDRTTSKSGVEYELLQSITLEPYTALDGSRTYACHYKLYVAADGNLGGGRLSDFPQWSDKYDEDWIIPNVDRLLIGRFKSFTTDPLDINSVKGVPICFRASDPIQEIHYLLDQMHNEFQLSEKVIMAPKRMFKKRWFNDGETAIDLPRGKDRLFMEMSNDSAGDIGITEWSPEIRFEAYLSAIDKQEKRVERAVGVSNGILSTPDDLNYQNVDNVRKSQQATMSFVNDTRAAMQDCMNDLVYAWNVLANYYQINPVGDYAVSFDWSDEYIETFSDRQNAILAGESIGATDAIDYRMLVFDESPEVARDNVERIKAERNAENSLLSLQEL